MTTVVQAKHNQVTTGTSISTVLDATPTAGNLLIAMLTVGGTITTPTYPWGVAAPDVSAGSGQLVYAFSKVAGVAESTTVSFSNATTRAFTLSVIEVATTPGKVWSLDKTASNTGTTVASLVAGPTAAQVEADDIAVAAVSLASSAGASQAWSDSYTLVTATGLPDLNTRGFTGYKALASTAATQTTATWTTARNAAILLATYKQSTPGTGQNSAFLALL